MANRCYYPNSCLCDSCFERLMGGDSPPPRTPQLPHRTDADLYRECVRSWGGCSCAGCERDKRRGTY